MAADAHSTSPFRACQDREETKGKFRGGKIAFFEIILTQTNAGVHKPLFEGYSYSLFKPRHT